MRIMFNGDMVEEIMEIDATPCWSPSKGSSEDNPEMYNVSFLKYITQYGIDHGVEEFDYVGEYNLDGTKETYEKAKANFRMICEKLLVNGWCRDTDFENFTWY